MRESPKEAHKPFQKFNLRSGVEIIEYIDHAWQSQSETTRDESYSHAVASVFSAEISTISSTTSENNFDSRG